ncbi:MAG: hypothetical protein DDG60_00685 [Anaerolineae bacterium]|nr:MAG: hypothetical protein DDG60_00685 [Anaerolineae bacterium]
MPQKHDPSTPSTAEILYAARRAASLLPEKEQETLKTLLLRARRGDKVTVHILNVLSKSPSAQGWLQHALYAPPLNTRGYEGLPGDPVEIPARSLWRCPKCGFTWRVLRKGRPVPPCPRDGSMLERVFAGEAGNDVG